MADQRQHLQRTDKWQTGTGTGLDVTLRHQFGKVYAYLSDYVIADGFEVVRSFPSATEFLTSTPSVLIAIWAWADNAFLGILPRSGFYGTRGPCSDHGMSEAQT
mgnify:CR=1 FL=1